jgi:quercetin dioxygenase-like cupin family protein
MQECARTKPVGLAKDAELVKLRDDMRALIPAEGPIVKDVHVRVEYGRGIAAHSHVEWTAIYYAFPGDPVCAIVADGARIEPARGDVIVLAPGVRHEVERSRSLQPRLSFAVCVDHLADLKQKQAIEKYQ